MTNLNKANKLKRTVLRCLRATGITASNYLNFVPDWWIPSKTDITPLSVPVGDSCCTQAVSTQHFFASNTKHGKQAERNITLTVTNKHYPKQNKTKNARMLRLETNEKHVRHID